jgi:CCCH-type zinc finger/Zinc finger C-x8-C-x5-C-x3-H type (and similar)
LKEIPNLLKTKLCAHFISGYCPSGDKCNYAHGFTELRKLNMNSGSQICSYFQQGMCKFGNNCKFLHITPEQSKYYGMKNKSSTLDRVPPWESDMKYSEKIVSKAVINSDISAKRDEPILAQVPNTDEAFFEPSKEENTGDFKFTLSYFK